MGNLVRACLGREYSLHPFEKQATLSWDLLMVFKVICYALFDVTPRSACSESNAGVRTRRCSAPLPASLLRLLYRRHVLKSKGNTYALSRNQDLFSKETSFSFDSQDDNGSSVYKEKEVVDIPESRSLEVLNRLYSEVLNLKSTLGKQEKAVQRLTEEVTSLRVTSASRMVESPTTTGSPIIAAPENVLSNACDSSNPKLDFCLSKAGHLVKLENMYVFQPVMSKPQKPVDEVRPCSFQDGGTGNANLEHHGTDSQSLGKGETRSLLEHSLGSQLSPVKLQSNGRRSLECKCGHYLDREFVLDTPTRTEIEVDELDNLSMCSYDSADTRDFQCVGIPKGLRRGDDFQEQMEWSLEDSSKGHIMQRDQKLSWTTADPDSAIGSRQVQQRYHELEEMLLKTLQSPRRELLPQIINSNSSSCSSSGSSSPRSTSSVIRHAGQSENGPFWEPSRTTGHCKVPQKPWSDNIFHTDLDFPTQTSTTYRGSNSAKGQSPHSLNMRTNGGEFDARAVLHPRATRQDETVVNPDLKREVSINDLTQVLRQTSANSRESLRESHGSSPAVDLGEDSRAELDIVEVALETFKVCKSGDIYKSDNHKRNRYDREDVTLTDSSLYRESQGSVSMSCGVNHLRRHSSFSQGTRQSRFAVEAARLSIRKQGHQRGGSF